MLYMLSFFYYYVMFFVIFVECHSGCLYCYGLYYDIVFVLSLRLSSVDQCFIFILERRREGGGGGRAKV